MFSLKRETKEVTLCFRKGGEDLKAGKYSLKVYPIFSSSIPFSSGNIHILYSVLNAFFFLHYFSPIFLYTVSNAYCTNNRQPNVSDIYVLGELGWSREQGFPQHHSSSETSITAATLYQERSAFPGLQVTNSRKTNKQ